MSEGENVKVAVRVRPFNGRERARNAELIVDMKGPATSLQNPENRNEEPRKFNFDYSYWSHDGSKEMPDGYWAKDSSHPNSAKFADQKTVYEDLGRGILNNAWEGYNSTLFAYGQTGSGKSWSMVGYGINKGIVPQYCEDTFKGIDEKKAAGSEIQFEVMFSMLEIYNEKVRDLLNPSSNTAGLKVRQHPKKGFYAEGLSNYAVDSYESVSSKMDEGTTNRTVASTQMNATSSRAHTIVGIKFIQKSKNSAGEETAKSSVVNLVDLAGSERADSTGATGDRLKEGAAINQSLSALGNVIAALAEKSEGKKVRVPYRDSVLTRLLKNALGGNSRTIMIAAISPADINYDESLSTLRYADRAKQIKTVAIVNEDPTEKLIRELQEENEKLKLMLESGQVTIDKNIDEDVDDMTEEEKEQIKKELEEDYKNQLADHGRELAEMKKSYEDKLKGAQAGESLHRLIKDHMERRKVVSHILNLNFDPQLTGKIAHFVDGEQVKVGSGREGACEIKLGGPSIFGQHAVFSIQGDKCCLEKNVSNARLLINGEPCTEKTDIHHNDRLMFGTTQLFLFINPSERDTKRDWAVITFEDAQEEIASNAGFDMKKGNKSKNDMMLQEDLMSMLPAINQANSMSEDLDKKVRFDMVMVKPEARGDLKGRTEVYVKVTNLETNLNWFWTKQKFIDRKFKMEEIFQKYQENENWQIAAVEDPFLEDEKADVPVGCCKVWLKSLAFGIGVKGVEEDYELEGYRGEDVGILDIEILPCDTKGKVIAEDSDDASILDPQELVGRDMSIFVNLKGTRGIPAKYTKMYAKYKFFDEKEFEMTKPVSTTDPVWNSTRQFAFKPVTKELINYLQTSGIIVQVWAEQKPPEIRKKINTRKAIEKWDLAIAGANSTNTNAKMVDPERQKLLMENTLLKIKTQRLERKMGHFKHLLDEVKKRKKQAISTRIVQGVYSAPSDKSAEDWYEKIGKMKFKVVAKDGSKQQPQPNDDIADDIFDILDVIESESKTCVIQ